MLSAKEVVLDCRQSGVGLMFAGLISPGSYYSSATPNQSGSFAGNPGVPTTTPYDSTVVVAQEQGLTGRDPQAGPFYLASAYSPPLGAFGLQPWTRSPYVSGLQISPTLGVPGLSGTDNPAAAQAVNGLTRSNAGLFGGLGQISVQISVQNVRFDFLTLAAIY